MVSLEPEVALRQGTGSASIKRAARARPTKKTSYRGLLWVLPALAAYGTFVLYPLVQTVRLSFYNWDGFGSQTGAGLSNYSRIFTEPQLLSSVVHSFILIIFFTVVPV